MGVFVDDMKLRAKVGNIDAVWSHLGADSIEEMHEFAQRLGLKRSWFQVSSSGIPHYDITQSMREKAIKMGAEEVTTKEGFRRLMSLRIDRSKKD